MLGLFQEGFRGYTKESAAQLQLRLPDHNKPFVPSTDASNSGMGAALMQEHNEKYYPIAYGSSKFMSFERRSCTFEKKYITTAFCVQILSLHG